VDALRERERRRAALMAEREAIAARWPARAHDARRLRAELETLADDWRHVLASDAEHARPIVSQLLVGRVTFTPLEQRARWKMSGEGTIAGLFAHSVISAGMASPTGTSRYFATQIRRSLRQTA
jgi:hypothetical protein